MGRPYVPGRSGIPLPRRRLSKAAEETGRAAAVAATSQLWRTRGSAAPGCGAMKRKRSGYLWLFLVGCVTRSDFLLRDLGSLWLEYSRTKYVWEMQITTHGPLQGLHVIEVSAFVAAPLGGMTLTKLGVDTHI